VVDENECARSQPREQRTKFDTDRPACTGDEDRRAGEIVAEPFDVDVNDGATEERARSARVTSVPSPRFVL
jgi:hypothetical protein